MKKFNIEAYNIKVKMKFTNCKFCDNMMSDESLSDGQAENFPVFACSQFMQSVAMPK